MKTMMITALLLAAAPGAVLADGIFRHPAIAAAEAPPTAYDYASKFYPHPAWLYLLAKAPQEMGEHPAVLVFRREQREQREQRARWCEQPALQAEDLMVRRPPLATDDNPGP